MCVDNHWKLLHLTHFTASSNHCGFFGARAVLHFLNEYTAIHRPCLFSSYSSLIKPVYLKTFFSTVNMWEQQHSNVFLFIPRIYLISQAFICKHLWAKASGWFNRGIYQRFYWRTKAWRLANNLCHRAKCPPWMAKGPHLGQFSVKPYTLHPAFNPNH